MEKVNPRLSFQVHNGLEADAGYLRVELIFRGIADFEPAQVARQVEPLRELLEKRILIGEIRSLLTGTRSWRSC